MDISKLKHNPEKIQESLFENENHELLTKTGCTIYIPAGYVSKGLAIISNEISILTTFIMVLDDNSYGVSTATAMAKISPDVIDTIEIEGDDYYQFTFNPGSVVMKTTLLIKNKKITNYILDFFVDYGHCPWFINYLNLAEQLWQTKYFNDLTLGTTQAVRDVLVSVVARDKKDVKKVYRHTLTSNEQLRMLPQYIPLRNISLNTTSNLARLNGSELKRGIRASLLAEETKVEPLEDLFVK